MVLGTWPALWPNHAFEPTAASGLRALAVPSSLRSSAAPQRERWTATPIPTRAATRRTMSDSELDASFI